jgi:hypothetical protein
MRASHLETAGPKSFCTRELTFVVLIALIGLSVSVRAKQVQHALHGSNQSTMTAKTDMPVPASLDARPLLRLADHIAPRPLLATFPAFGAQSALAQRTETLWNSIAVQHRPPPQSPL